LDFLQHPLQALVLSENVVDKQALYDDPQQLQPGEAGLRRAQAELGHVAQRMLGR
jgi:hypothetical protein